uniref:ARAD1B11176p n=1 Tax=Blastobotrys adeninivorans TaxID=409370 RepID=A0A060T6D6_BLAAD
MILKPWTELPTPRHLLDENDDLDEASAGFILQWVPWTKIQLQQQVPEGAHLCVVASRLESYARSLARTGKAVGEITVGVDHAPIAQESGEPATQVDSLQLYDGDMEADTRKTIELFKTTVSLVDSKTVVVCAPPLEPKDCYTFAEQLLSLKPAKVTILTPCSVLAPKANEYVYALGNVGAGLDLPALEPPSSISGPSASVMALAHSSSIPVTAIAVQADGAVGHEYVDHEATEHVIGVSLGRLLGVPAVVRHSIDHDSMYL